MKQQTSKINFPDLCSCHLAVMHLANLTNYDKKCCKNNILHKQQGLLKDTILSDGTQNFFTVFDMSCASGKTYVVINSIPFYLLEVAKGNLPPKGILVVLRETTECDTYSNKLNEMYPFDVALSFHSKVYGNSNTELSKRLKQELIKKVPFAPVVFITHENYINLAENEKSQKLFTTDRRLLIIDESIDICEIAGVCNKTTDNQNLITFEEIETLENDLIEEDKFIFKSIITPLFNKIDDLKGMTESIKNTTYNFKINHKHFNEQIYIFERKINNRYKKKSIYNKLKRTLKILKLIYNDTCLINKGLEDEEKEEYIEIKTINRNKKMWTLDNNIILDASAPLELKYILDKDLYFLMNNEIVIDYPNWKIEFVLSNSTKYAKGIGKKKKTKKQIERYVKHLNGCSQIIIDLGKDDVLVVCHKEEHIQINKITEKEIPFNPFAEWVNVPLENIEHIGNITGKREFGNLKNVLITHTPNYSDSDYILQYMYYNNTRYEDNKTFEQTSVENLGYTYMFKNQELQEFKEKTIANHIYQAVCRVNREMKSNTTVVIISQYLGAILYVRDMLDCKCEILRDYDEYFLVGENPTNEERKQNSKKQKLEDLFVEILKGNIKKEIDFVELYSNIIKISKQDIKNVLGFDDNQFNKAKNFNKEFITNNSIYFISQDEIIFILDKANY